MLKPHHPVLVLGDLKPRALGAVQSAAAAVGAPVARCEEWQIPGLDPAIEPLAIIAPTAGGHGFSQCASVRSDPRFSRVPLIVLGQERNSISFGELFQSGGDDLIRPGDGAALVRRLRAIRAAAPSKDGSARVRATERHAVVAGPPSKWLGVVARTLSNAGIPIRFAATATEVIEASPGARAVVAIDDLGPDGAELALAEARRAGSDTPWVIVAEPRRVAALSIAVQALDRVAVIDSYAPPENALFVANELAASTSADQRSTARLLYGTALSFRVAGREDEDDVAFTYNVSAGGLFARTLAPLEPQDRVWLELSAPRSSRRVRLAGTVAWRRPFGPNESATVPAGFGVQITEGLAGDLQRWVDSCALLEREERRVRPPQPVARARSFAPRASAAPAVA